MESAQGLAADGETKRRILKEGVVKGIRFPTMKQEDFAGVVLESEILKPKEIVSIIQHLNSVSKSPVGFPEAKRSGFGRDIQRCFRFGKLSGRCSYDNSLRYESINFSADKDIVLLGLCLLGSENNNYSVSLDIKDSTSEEVLVSKTGEFPSKQIQGEKCSYYGFQVLFDEKITLNKNTKYAIWAKITGPDSLRGDNGIGSVKCREVTFTFMKRRNSPYNGTTVQYGQFPELLFFFSE